MTNYTCYDDCAFDSAYYYEGYNDSNCYASRKTWYIDEDDRAYNDYMAEKTSFYNQYNQIVAEFNGIY